MTKPTGQNFWIAFVVGVALMILALVCRLLSRRRDNNGLKPSPCHHLPDSNDINDDASIASESSYPKENETTNRSMNLSQWFRKSWVDRPSIESTKAGTSSVSTSTLTQESSVAERLSRSTLRIPSAKTAYVVVTPKISPANPLHSQRGGAANRKFSFDNDATSNKISITHDDTSALEIVRTQSWEQSIRRWTMVILSSNAEAPDQSEVSV